MERKLACMAILSLSALCVGCGGSDDAAPADQPAAGQSQAQAAKKDVPTPDHVVSQFLEAVRTGDDEKAASLLTDTARVKTAEADMVVAPSGSNTASFKVGEWEPVYEGQGAHVASTWTDLGEDGQPHTDEIIWVLRNEPVGWRIAGMITKVFPDQPPLVLDFENPAQMQEQQMAAEQELQKRAQQAQVPSGTSDTAEPVRR